MKGTSKKYKLSNVPLIKELWAKYRKKKILHQHQTVANFWSQLIQKYFDEKIPKNSLKPKKELGGNIIWQYWGQGIDEDKLPEIVKICFASVDQYKGNNIVIRLSDDNIAEYLDLPDYVWNEYGEPKFERVFFSDLLRVSLLSTYGGVWLDATILLTGELPKIIFEMDYFMFQRSCEEDAKTKKYWENTYAYYWNWGPLFKVNVLNSVIFSKEKSLLISVIQDLLLYYWKTQNEIVDYFFFQILYNELITGVLKENKCKVVSDVLPHLLQTKINGKYEEITFEEVLDKVSIHKMTYFDEIAMSKLKIILKH